MKSYTKSIAFILAVSILLSSCASTTMILSEPAGAKLYLNGEPMGTTPYSHSDTKIVGTTTEVRLEKEGYQTLHTSFSRNEQVDVGAVIGGILILAPFLWTMKYNGTHRYELIPTGNSQTATTGVQQGRQQESTSKPKADKLRELKQLLDENIITKDEYETGKEKILNENR